MAEDQSESIWIEVRARLLADAAIVAALGSEPQRRIVRRAIPGDVLPCIICPSLELTDRGTDDSDAGTVRLELHIWSLANDYLPVSGVTTHRAAHLKSLVKNALHWAPIGIRCTVERIAGPLPDPEPDFVHYLVVVEAISQHAAL